MWELTHKPRVYAQVSIPYHILKKIFNGLFAFIDESFAVCAVSWRMHESRINGVMIDGIDRCGFVFKGWYDAREGIFACSDAFDERVEDGIVGGHELELIGFAIC